MAGRPYPCSSSSKLCNNAEMCSLGLKQILEGLVLQPVVCPGMAWHADRDLEMRTEGSWGLKTRSRILKAGSLCAQTEVFLPSVL